MPRDVACICGHDLGQHPPDSQRPFAWPCRSCECREYRQVFDEGFDADGLPLEHGRCDSCGAPCDGDGCTADHTHEIA